MFRAVSRIGLVWIAAAALGPAVVGGCRHLSVPKPNLRGGSDGERFSDAAKFNRPTDQSTVNPFAFSTRAQEIEKDLGVR